MNRLAVKADSASLSIPSLEFEIPPNTQKGSVNTLEGFLLLSIEELEQDQPTRRVSESINVYQSVYIHYVDTSS